MSDVKSTLNKNIPVKEYAKKLDRGFMWLFSWEKMKLYIFATLMLFTALPAVVFVMRLFMTFSYAGAVDIVIVSGRVLTCIALWVLIRDIIAKRTSLRECLKNHIPQLLFIAFAAYIFLSCLTRGFSIWDFYNFGEILHENMLTFITYALYFTVVVSLLREEKYKKHLIDLYIIVMNFLALVALFAYYVHDFGQFSVNEGIAVVFFEFNYYAYFLTMGILLSAVMAIRSENTLKRVLYSLSYLLNVYVLIINNTFGCYLATFFGLLFLVIVSSIVDKKFNWKALLVFASFIIVSLVMSLWTDTIFTNIIKLSSDVQTIAADSQNAGDAGTGRWELWMENIKLIKQEPVFGVGISAFSRSYMKDLHTMIIRSHNEILQYAGWFGIPSAILYVAAVMAVYLKGLKYRKHIDTATLACLTAAFGYFISSFFGLTVYTTAPFFFIFIGLGLAINVPETEDKAAEAVPEKKEVKE